MNRPLLFSAVLLLILAFLMILRSQVDEGGIAEEGSREGGSQNSLRNGNDVDGTATDSNQKKLSNRKLRRESIAKLRSLGYQFSADQTKKRSAVGNVTLITPDGGILKSDYMSISSDGDYIYLEGEILVETKSEDETFKMKYSGENASAKIGLDGKSLSLIGDVMTTSQTSEADQ